MKARERKLIIEQLDKKILPISLIETNLTPTGGWIESLRKALGLNLRQLANRLNRTPQAVKQLQEREVSGSISLNSLQEVADKMGMRVVYALVPKDNGSIVGLLQKRATEKAYEITNRTNQTMLLEDQSVSIERMKKSMEDLRDELVQNPEKLWD